MESAHPHGIKAVTFTNKAAAEMRSRIEQLLQMRLNAMWVGTFHSLAHRLLRLHWQDAGLPQTFQILDSDDQYRIVRRIIRQFDLDESRWQPKQAQWFINDCKDEGLRPEYVDTMGDPYRKQMLKIYQEYERQCRQTGMVDFAELLLRAHELWLHQPHLLEHYRNRFAHILVDEFQDTNTIQYAWIRMLSGNRRPVCAVGDDDQSIYGWRGARIENIQKFSDDFANTQTVRLEQNYRSTGNILNAANAVIANNFERLGKNLWTDSGNGDDIELYRAYNEQDEARHIVNQIEKWVQQDGRYDEAAVLYRSNAQSRVIEEALLQASVPYRVYGGLRFFERAEIKDALAYVRLLHNPLDDASFERIVNTPTRGIGDKTLATVRNHARARELSMTDATKEAIANKLLSARALAALQRFLDLMEEMRADIQDMELQDLMEHAIHQSTLFEYYERDQSEKGRAKLENLQELITACQQFEYIEEEEDMDKLSAFLSYAALEAGEQQNSKDSNCVQLMTLHSAKGLEYPLVFMSGMEEDLFPSERSLQDPERLEEERRLCYVGITRAMKKLTLSYAESRRLYGSERYPVPSRFIREIPKELVSEVSMGGAISQNPAYQTTSYQSSSPQQEAHDFYMGQRVYHHKFGDGVVLNFEGQGTGARVQINFDNAGNKWLVVSLAKLEPA